MSDCPKDAKCCLLAHYQPSSVKAAWFANHLAAGGNCATILTQVLFLSWAFLLLVSNKCLAGHEVSSGDGGPVRRRGEIKLPSFVLRLKLRLRAFLQALLEHTSVCRVPWMHLVVETWALFMSLLRLSPWTAAAQKQAKRGPRSVFATGWHRFPSL